MIRLKGWENVDLYVLRHAEAGPALHDEDRVLTDHGRAQAKAAAEGIARLELQIDTILSSPVSRAMQTAQPVAQALGVPVKTLAALAPGCTPEEALAQLEGQTGTMLLVGHEPQLSGLLCAFSGGRVHMRKAMLAWVEVETTNPPQGSLAGLLSWKHLSRISRK